MRCPGSPTVLDSCTLVLGLASLFQGPLSVLCVSHISYQEVPAWQGDLSNLADLASSYSSPIAIVCIVWPLSIISFLFFYLQRAGLPQYYLQVSVGFSVLERFLPEMSADHFSPQAPPTVPNFYASLWRRTIFKWFMVAEVLRDFWLAPPYGRNWSYLVGLNLFAPSLF